MLKKISLLSGVLLLSGFTVYNVFSNVTKVGAVEPCLVTIFGKTYDVGPLQTGHSGGNIFTCNTDMSNVYQSQHGTNVSRISSFLVISPTATPTIVPNVTPTVTPTGTPTVTPTVTPASTPTVTPIDDDDDDHDIDDDHDMDNDDDDHEEDKHRDDDDHDDDHDSNRRRGKSEDHASEQGIASRNEHSQRDRDND